MTVIRPNSISGVSSITGNGGDISIFRADGTAADVTVNNITSGVVTATKFVGPIEGNLSGGTINATSGTITGNLGVGGVLTYEDVTNIDSIGIITARAGINVSGGTITGDGSGLTGVGLGTDGSANTSGIITATAFVPTIGQLSHRNMVINGASTVSQRYGTTSTTISGTAPQFVVDRFVVQTNVGGGTQSHQQVADAPAGFYYSQKVTSGTGGGNPGTAFARYRTTLEWQDVIPQSGFGTSGAKQLVLSFYVKSSLTGTFGVAVQSYTNTRNIVNTYTINSANTWERKTVVITADTNNAWVASTGVHMEIGWDLGEGTGRSTGTLNTWGAGLSGYGYNSGVKFFTQASATWQITGVQLEVGPVATPFEHRSVGDELARCQRYYYQVGPLQSDIFGQGRTDNDNVNMYVLVHYPVTMRSAPATLTTTGNAGNYDVRRDTTKGCSAVPTIHAASSTHLAQINCQSSSHGWGTASPMQLQADGGGSAFLGFSAEL
jgi:hypothetical protein